MVRQAAVPDRAALVVVIANWGWVAASVGLLFTDWVEPTTFGLTFVAGQAAIVAVFAILQGRFLRLRRPG